MRDAYRLFVPLISAVGCAGVALYGQPAFQNRSRADAMNSELQRLRGNWTGTRTERNPVTGLPFTINFEFVFNDDGTYLQRAGFGRLTILEVEGRFNIRRASDPRDPTVTHLLELVPARVIKTPTEQDLRALLVADLPNVESSSHYLSFYNLAPAGAATLRYTRAGSETWGLKRLLQ